MEQETQAFKATPEPVVEQKHWFKGTVPPHLLEAAPRRLGLLAVVAALVLLSGFIFFFEVEESFIEGVDSRIISITAVIYSVVISAAVFIVTRIKTIPATTIITIGFIWEVLFALGLAVAQRMESWEAYQEFRGFSAVAALLICYAVIVPGGSMTWIAVTSILTALMDPLGLMINVAFGKVMPPLAVQVSMFVPTILAVFVAVFCAGIVFRLGQAIQRAKQLGSYRLVEPLGKGGMGEVWRAEHHMLARPAAIKLIRPETLGAKKGEDAGLVLQRFKQEAQATALLDSEHTIHLYDYGATEDGSLFYVMELLDGVDLEELVERTGPVCPERAVCFLLQACDSLIEAHARGLIHCDIKPANIFVCHKGGNPDFIKVLDFGLVKKAKEVTRPGEKVRGTPAYLSPEVILGELKPDARSDIYSLGCVAYWLLSGQMVFERDSSKEILMDHVDSEPPRLGTRTRNPVPPKLESIVHACLKKEPDDRPQSVSELACLLGEVPISEEWTPERAGRWWSENFPGRTN
jgi:tRNA A-37 threonylcarbamoyl transferase component Bud32